MFWKSLFAAIFILFAVLWHSIPAQVEASQRLPPSEEENSSYALSTRMQQSQSLQLYPTQQTIPTSRILVVLVRSTQSTSFLIICPLIIQQPVITIIRNPPTSQFLDSLALANDLISTYFQYIKHRDQDSKQIAMDSELEAERILDTSFFDNHMNLKIGLPLTQKQKANIISDYGCMLSRIACGFMKYDPGNGIDYARKAIAVLDNFSSQQGKLLFGELEYRKQANSLDGHIVALRNSQDQRYKETLYHFLFDPLWKKDFSTLGVKRRARTIISCADYLREDNRFFELACALSLFIINFQGLRMLTSLEESQQNKIMHNYYKVLLVLKQRSLPYQIFPIVPKRFFHYIRSEENARFLPEIVQSPSSTTEITLSPTFHNPNEVIRCCDFLLTQSTANEFARQISGIGEEIGRMRLVCALLNGFFDNELHWKRFPPFSETQGTTLEQMYNTAQRYLHRSRMIFLHPFRLAPTSPAIIHPTAVRRIAPQLMPDTFFPSSVSATSSSSSTNNILHIQNNFSDENLDLIPSSSTAFSWHCPPAPILRPSRHMTPSPLPRIQIPTLSTTPDQSIVTATSLTPSLAPTSPENTKD